VALGSDTGGSVRQPAAFCGVYGLKPTYGRLSRYGLVAYASSLETIGILGTDPHTIGEVLRAGSGIDVHDQTSIEPPSGERQTAFPKRVAFLGCDDELDDATREAYARMREVIAAQGAEIVEVELATADVAVSAYYTIATAEASANLARFNGVRYGERPIYAENPEELVRSARSQGFGEEVLLRILLGTYVLRSGFQEQYYQKAQRIRTAIRNELHDLFSGHELLVLPVFPTVAFEHGDAGLSPFQQKLADRFTTLANLTALPALSIPAGVYNGLPVGIQVMGPALCEERLLAVADRIGRDLPPELPPDYATPVIGGAGGGA
jgi:aspartyl-tRNA(Asn)/glutamyl-tRNA(Gln) amidotransferase subunit A